MRGLRSVLLIPWLLIAAPLAGAGAMRIPRDSPPEVTSTDGVFRIVTEYERPRRRQPGRVTWYVENTGDGVWVPIKRSCDCIHPDYHHIYVRDPEGWAEIVPPRAGSDRKTSWRFVDSGERWRVLSVPMDDPSHYWSEMAIEFLYADGPNLSTRCIAWPGESE